MGPRYFKHGLVGKYMPFFFYFPVCFTVQAEDQIDYFYSFLEEYKSSIIQTNSKVFLKNSWKGNVELKSGLEADKRLSWKDCLFS